MDARPQAPDRATVALRAALLATFVSSIFHYTDNYVRFDQYAQGTTGPITKPVIAVSWVAFTVFGAAGYVLYRRGRWSSSAWCLMYYSVGGLISPLHYTTVPPSSFDAFQHTFIITDLLAGASVLWFALWLLSTRARSQRRPA
jgi:hypothetical protein